MKRLVRWGIILLAAALMALLLLWLFPSHRADEPAPLPAPTRTATSLPTATLAPTIPPTPTPNPDPLFSF
ncbi:MAG: hypothetical protein HGA86_03365, partial [Anaerolineaceae bacterium]|nr:hypothetical protein [Anaerolineaceae bacterium]